MLRIFVIFIWKDVLKPQIRTGISKKKEVILCLLFINTNVQSLVGITQNKQVAVKKNRKNLLPQSLSLSY